MLVNEYADAVFSSIFQAIGDRTSPYNNINISASREELVGPGGLYLRVGCGDQGRDCFGSPYLILFGHVPVSLRDANPVRSSFRAASLAQCELLSAVAAVIEVRLISFLPAFEQ